MKWKLSVVTLKLSVVSLVVLVCGCASYTNRTAQMKLDYATCNYPSAAEAILSEDADEDNMDQVLFLLERAKIEGELADYPASNRDYDEANRLIDEYEQRSAVNVSDATNETGAAVVNETILPYKGEGYEKILLHTYRALNFLMYNDIDDARVAINAMNDRMKREEELHAEEIAEAKEEGKEKKVTKQQATDIEQQFFEKWGQSSQELSKVKSVYQSPFGSYLSALVYDIQGQPDEAEIDAGHIIEATPDFPLDYIPGQADPQQVEGKGRLVVIYQMGLAPVKRQIMIPIPLPHHGTASLISTAFAVYDRVPTQLGGAEIMVDGQEAGTTTLLSNIDDQAIQALVDRIPATIIRGVIRAVIKGTAVMVAEQQAGAIGNILGSVAAVASEQADLRSWLTLPKNIQAALVYADPGPHKITIQPLDIAGNPVGVPVEKDVEFQAGKTVLANVPVVWTTNGRLSTRTTRRRCR